MTVAGPPNGPNRGAAPTAYGRGKGGLKAEKHVAKELDVKSKDLDKAVREAASEVS